MDPSSFSETSDSIRYAYNLEKNGANYRVVVEELNNGRKAINYYSSRNFVEFREAKALPHPSDTKTIPEAAKEVKSAGKGFKAQSPASVGSSLAGGVIGGFSDDKTK
ncbi:MAG: DUF3519 domain-containing protein [Helicobacteraceae bacterium]|nr:DUF3519 domain-containing protein [Helicobacteraceae bacterium]